MHSNALTKTPCLQYHQQISQSSKQIAVKISLKAKKKTNKWYAHQYCCSRFHQTYEMKNQTDFWLDYPPAHHPHPDELLTNINTQNITSYQMTSSGKKTMMYSQQTVDGTKMVKWYHFSVSSYKTQPKVTKQHRPFGITQCYLPPNIGECIAPWPQSDTLALDLPTPEGWQAELTLVWLYIKMVYLSANSTNHLRATQPGVRQITLQLQVQCLSATLKVKLVKTTVINRHLTIIKKISTFAMKNAWELTVFVATQQVNVPCLNPSQTGWHSIYLSCRDRRLSQTLVIYRDGLPVHMQVICARQRPNQVSY